MDKHSLNQHVRNVHLSVVLDSDAENSSIYSHCERSDEDRCRAVCEGFKRKKMVSGVKA
jgi:hypothetical protein